MNETRNYKHPHLAGFFKRYPDPHDLVLQVEVRGCADWYEDEISELVVERDRAQKQLNETKALLGKFLQVVEGAYGCMPSYGELRDGLDLRALADEVRYEAILQAVAHTDEDGFGLD